MVFDRCWVGDPCVWYDTRYFHRECLKVVEGTIVGSAVVMLRPGDEEKSALLHEGYLLFGGAYVLLQHVYAQWGCSDLSLVSAVMLWSK